MKNNNRTTTTTAGNVSLNSSNSYSYLSNATAYSPNITSASNNYTISTSGYASTGYVFTTANYFETAVLNYLTEAEIIKLFNTIKAKVKENDIDVLKNMIRLLRI